MCVCVRVCVCACVCARARTRQECTISVINVGSDIKIKMSYQCCLLNERCIVLLFNTIYSLFFISIYLLVYFLFHVFS